MKLRLAYMFVVTIIAIVFLGVPAAGEDTSSKPAFVDLDGDGFNDQAPDLNNDGIPDQIVSKAQNETPKLSGLLGNILDEFFDGSSLLSKRERFDKLKFAARGISLHRGGFNCDEGFGPGNGIGLGAMSNSCPGGVCRPH